MYISMYICFIQNKVSLGTFSLSEELLYFTIYYSCNLRYLKKIKVDARYARNIKLNKSVCYNAIQNKYSMDLLNIYCNLVSISKVLDFSYFSNFLTHSTGLLDY